MRCVAEFLFWAGRIETIVALMFLVHLLVFWLLGGNWAARLATGAWFIAYLVLSTTVLYDWVVGPSMEGVDYVIAHFYGGLWNDSEALSSMLSRWSTVLFPIYLPWLAVWMLGLFAILLIFAIGHRTGNTASRPAGERGTSESPELHE